MVLLAALLAVRLQAQDTTDPGPKPAPIIRAIEIHRQDVFDSAQARSWLTRLVNTLHLRTRTGVVRRELLFREGDPYDSLQAIETARNLRRLGIFREVSVDTATRDSGLVTRVTTRDAWSTRLDFRIRSTGGQVDYGFGLIEDNLFGNATKATARFRRNPDRTTTVLQLSQPRLIARSITPSVGYEDRSDGRRAGMSLDRPFFSLTTTWGGFVTGEYRDEAILRFFGGEEVASDTTFREYWLARAEVARALRADNEGYTRLGWTAQIRRDDYSPDSAGPFGNSVTTAVGPFLEWRRADFLVTRGFVGVGRDEDVDLSTTVRLGLIAAPEFLGYDRNGIGTKVQIHGGFRVPLGFAFFDLAANGLHSTAGLDSGSVFVAGTAAFRPFPGHLLLTHLQAGWIKDPLPGTEFDYGFSQGPRAFRTHAFTGDRAVLGTAEYRVIVADNLFDLAALGIAAFADRGGAWYSGSPRRWGTTVGLGLRIYSTRVASLSPNRIDFAYRAKNDVMPGGWVVTIAKGLVFSTTPR